MSNNEGARPQRTATSSNVTGNERKRTTGEFGPYSRLLSNDCKENSNPWGSVVTRQCVEMEGMDGYSVSL